MALQNTDLFIVERGSVQYKMTPDQIADFLGATRDYTVADIAGRDALPNLNVGDKIFVTDATSEPDVDLGWAIYRVSSTGPNVFVKISEQESLDLVVVGATNLSYNPSPTQGEITNDTGDNAIIPAVNGTNAGLATPAMFLAAHNAASPGLTPATNPININGSQQITFGITQLDALP